MAAYYPLFEEEIKEGPPGMPGIGFKLTHDGDYDMEKKVLKNVKGPLDPSDSATKGYVDLARTDLKLKILELTDHALIHSDTGSYNAKQKRISNLADPREKDDSATMNYVDIVKENLETYIQTNGLFQAVGGSYDAKGKIIGNVKDPEFGKNVVNKRYFERNALVVQEGVYDAKNKQIVNLADPNAEHDGVNKQYFENNALILKDQSYDAKSKIISNVEEPKKENDVVTKKHLDYYCILWDKTNKCYFAHNSRIYGVKKPLLDMDCANKYYVDMKTFCATTDRGVQFTGDGFKTFQFNKTTSKLLDSNLKLSQNMFMKVTVFLACDNMNEKPKIRLEKEKEVLLDRDIRVNEESITMFAYGKLNEVLTLSILTGGRCKLKPYLHIEKLEFI